jgi:hypothetical protein
MSPIGLSDLPNVVYTTVHYIVYLMFKPSTNISDLCVSKILRDINLLLFTSDSDVTIGLNKFY